MMRKIDNPLLQGSPCVQGEPNPCAVPLAKRGEPTEGGQSGTLAARLVQQKGGKAQLASLPLTV
jgi:hypothetical protein